MKTKQQKTNKPYVDGFVLSVPTKNLKAYQKMALDAGKVWKKHGALDYKECVGEDLTPQGDAEVMTFPGLVKPKKGETVFFSFIVYKSKKHRDEVNAKVMKEMSEYMAKHKNIKMPFDMKRMAYGGFQSIVSL
jgi:uncharacterized protein YbaA (DUF1428 family)